MVMRVLASTHGAHARTRARRPTYGYAGARDGARVTRTAARQPARRPMLTLVRAQRLRKPLS